MSDDRYAPTDSDQRFSDSVQAAVARLDPVPHIVVEAARASFDWGSIDTELARLTYDSCTEQRATAGVRGDAWLRQLHFESDELSLDLQVIAEGTPRVVIGEIVPRTPAEVQIFHPGGVSTVLTDEHGRFRADDVMEGDTTLRCRVFAADGDKTLRTSWVLL